MIVVDVITNKGGKLWEVKRELQSSFWGTFGFYKKNNVTKHRSPEKYQDFKEHCHL